MQVSDSECVYRDVDPVAQGRSSHVPSLLIQCQLGQTPCPLNAQLDPQVREWTKEKETSRMSIRLVVMFL